MIRSLLVALSLSAGAAMAEPAIVAVEVMVPGMAGEQVEEAITIPIEKAMRLLPRAQGAHSSSGDGRSVVEIAFDGEPTATDVRDVARAVATARGRFRQYTGEPKVTVRPRGAGWDPKP